LKAKAIFYDCIPQSMGPPIAYVDLWKIIVADKVHHLFFVTPVALCVRTLSCNCGGRRVWG